MNAATANSNATAQEEPSTTTSSEDEDYGYDTPIEQQTVVGESLLPFMLMKIVSEWKH